MTGDNTVLMPWEYYEVHLCRLYHCTPADLDRQDPARIMKHLEVLSGESLERKLKQPKRRK